MSGRIPQQFIDELIARTDIAEVIGARVRLKKAGREFKACCPFHEEKTPSFTVSPTKQFYHCFGCGVHGTALGFIMEYEGRGFIEAIEDLAAQAGMEVPRSSGGDAPVRPRTEIYATLGEAAAYYCEQLKKNGPAVDYLKERGLSGEIAREFAIGHAPDSWDALVGSIGADTDARKHLTDTGMIKPRQGGNGFYDMFRNRIMFPIRDTRGRVIAFGGRALGDGEPKYLNSPESPLFHKGRELYGLHEARQALRDISTLLVVEGYMDVVGLAQHGIRNVVATLGTACTEAHLDRLFRIAENVVFCFDGDRAGRKAAWRALENALGSVREGRRIDFLFLPDGHDPDSLVRAEGAERFRQRIDAALPLSEYMVQQLAEQTDLDHVDGRARFVELARPLVEGLPDGVYREMLVDRIGQTVRMEPARLRSLLGSTPQAARKPRRRARHRISTGRGNLVRQAITLLLHYPGIAAQVDAPQQLPQVDRPGVDVLARLLAELQAQPELSTAMVLERWREDAVGSHLATLAATEPLVEEEEAVAELRNSLLHLVARDVSRRRADELMTKARQKQLSAEEKLELQQLLRDRGRPQATGDEGRLL
ncbi:MAG: DNA primase [Gammaproteobacteria bacterium]|nr:DNA primase [Gammaproteobacteria bacterium]NNF60958.1 DNA primase [Gammaproteobacteria bacterium]NNM21668.1 DNA primase [Gammaproteobacteria bacterium]